MENEDKKIEETSENEETEVTEEQSTAAAGIVPGLIDREITEEVHTAFLAYSMSVIVSRAIPDVRDGLKPVQRRIIYGMDESGMQPGKPYKKSARIVGDVMGKYHPHGDSALYGTLVRLAQPFSLRYTLVDGHGNFGSIDGDEAAAMRYTEARMNKLAVEMVRDLDKDTVDFVDNYDGTEREPSVLPSRIPNLIINGSEGIAVGMATNMAPHNLSETIHAIVALCRNPDLTIEELMRDYIPGPDFPTGGVILGRQGIADAYKTGTGTITIRSRYHIEENEGHKAKIIVTEIPYQVNKSAMIEKMAELVRDKVLDGISDIRDESNKDGIRVVIEVKNNFMPEIVVNNLLKHTDLQTNFGIINLCLVNNAPKILGMKDLLQNYIDFQIDVLTRRTKKLLDIDSKRDHIVTGLILAHDNIDDVIAIIRSSKTDEESTQKLEAKYGLSDEQVASILAMTLRRLQGLEQDKLHAEHNQLTANIAEYNRLLSDKANIVELLIQEITEIERKYGDARLTTITDDAANIDNEDLIPQENIVVVLTKNGYIKRMSDDTFRTQNRGGRGVKGVTTTNGDFVRIIRHIKTHTDVLFFSSTGKVYRMRGYQIPEGTRDAKGLPIVNLLPLDTNANERIVSIVSCDDYDPNDYLFFATVNGLVKRTKLSEYESIHQNGKRAIGLREGDELLDVKRTKGNTIISLAASTGKVCTFNEADAREMGRDATGVKGMEIDEGSKIVDLTTSEEGTKLLVLTTAGYGKISYVNDTDVTDEEGNVRHYDGYRMTTRGARGVLSLKMGAKNGELTAMRAVNGDEDLMVITNKGIVIRTPLSQIKIAGRNTQGVKIINLEPHNKVAAITIVPHEEESEEEEMPIIEDDEMNPSLVGENEDNEAEEVVTPDDVI